MVAIFWTAQAEADLQSIFEYIAKGSRKYALLQVGKIKGATHILRKQPLAGKAVAEYNSASIREIIEGNYRIIYSIVDEYRVDILLVHHCARNLEKRIIY